jgi:hypothetical protein
MQNDLIARQESDERSKKLITDFGIATGWLYCSNFAWVAVVKMAGQLKRSVKQVW